VKKGWGCPVPSCAKKLQLAPSGSNRPPERMQLSLSAKIVMPLGKHIEERAKCHTGRRVRKKSVRNNCMNSKFRE